MADILKPKKCMCGNKVIPHYTGMAWQIKCNKCGRSVGAWGCAAVINKWNRNLNGLEGRNVADILIRGMKMPKDQPVLVFIWPDGRVFPSGVYKSNEWDGVKAVPLPEGHGRLGDLDAIVKRLDEMEADFNKKEFYQGTLWFHVIAELLKTAPTIVPAEGGGADG